MSILMLNTDDASPAGMKHACNLWKNPKTCKYEVDYLEHHRTDLIPAFIKVANVKVDKLAPTPHKWAKEMHAFADGYEIECKPYGSRHWSRNTCPIWSEHNEYRIKPEPAPIKLNIISFHPVLQNNSFGRLLDTIDDVKSYMPETKRVIRIEFNPNDQTLVSAEVVAL